MYDVYGKAAFRQGNIYKCIFHYKSESKRETIVWKHTDSLLKKGFPAQWSVNKVMLTVSCKQSFLLATSLEKITFFIERRSYKTKNDKIDVV